MENDIIFRNTIDKIQNDRSFQEAIKNNQLIVFAGAGISKRFNLPDWNKLVEMIIFDLQDKKPNEQGLSCFKTLMEEKWLTPLQVISLLQKKYEREIIGFVQDKLVIKGNPDFNLHKKILELSEKIVTTNFDKAFEQASNNQLRVISNDNRFSLGRLQNMKSFLFKIHGDIDELENCVFFENKYQELYKSMPEHLAIRELSNIFVQKTILFIGFGLNDPYIDEIFSSLFERYKYPNKHYIITTDSNFENSKHASYIEPLFIQDYIEAEAVLDELLTIKKEGPENIRRHNLKPKSLDFIGREEFVESITEALKENSSLIVIEALPGTGKTSLATELGYVCIGQSSIKPKDTVLFDFVVWFSPRENPTCHSWWPILLDEIGRVMNNRRITNALDKKAKAIEIDNYLQSSEKRLLLIIDEFDIVQEDDELRHWIINQLLKRAKIIVTTHVHLPISDQKNFTLPGFKLWEALQFIEQQIKDNSKLNYVNSPENHNKVVELVNLTHGNPRILELAIGCLKHMKLDLNRIREELDLGPINIVDNLHERCWTTLKDVSKAVLMLFPQFTGSHSIAKEALYKTSPQSSMDVECALQELSSWNLIYAHPGQRYTIHPVTLEYVRYKTDPRENERFEERWSKFYLDFVRVNVVRKSPNTLYWNALVSDKMNVLEEEWTAIQEVMQWADNNHQDELLLELVMLLVHFMDSRFYNQERLKFVRKAIAVCEKKGNKQYEEALLRIDALGWTYTEESDFEEALKEIDRGLALLDGLNYSSKEAGNLKALAYAWKSRIKLEQENESDRDEAAALLHQTDAFAVDPWIKTRIKMMEGDLEMQRENFVDAANHYLEARKLTDPTKGGYGFEGHNYQINPRIGFAYLEIGALTSDRIRMEESFNHAKEMFEELVYDPHIAIGRLYGQYGLARIAFETGKKLDITEIKQNAIRDIEAINAELSCRTNSNLLKKLIEKFLTRSLH